jgi:hypothetical protein
MNFFTLTIVNTGLVYTEIYKVIREIHGGYNKMNKFCGVEYI